MLSPTTCQKARLHCKLNRFLWINPVLHRLILCTKNVSSSGPFNSQLHHDNFHFLPLEKAFKQFSKIISQRLKQDFRKYSMNLWRYDWSLSQTFYQHDVMTTEIISGNQEEQWEASFTMLKWQLEEWSSYLSSSCILFLSQ